MPGRARGVERFVGKTTPKLVGQTANLRRQVVQLALKFIAALAKLVAFVAKAQQVLAHASPRQAVAASVRTVPVLVLAKVVQAVVSRAPATTAMVRKAEHGQLLDVPDIDRIERSGAQATLQLAKRAVGA